MITLYFYFFQPGTIITTEIDQKKLKRYKELATLANGDVNSSLPIQSSIKPNVSKPTVESLKKDITAMRLKLDRRNIKLSKIADTLVFIRHSVTILNWILNNYQIFYFSIGTLHILNSMQSMIHFLHLQNLAIHGY